MGTNLFYEAEKIVSRDHVATPRFVVENIYSLIDIQAFKSLWFPFNHYDSQFKLMADELKLMYRATHIFDDLGNDFFTTEPPKHCDLMISNPPFSEQNRIIERSFELIRENKIQSFALLLPLATLETEKRANLFQQYEDKLAILIFKKRIKFLGHTSSFNRGCCWICYNIPALKERPIQWV
ncbi:sugar-phosphate nucleotidyltransferase [Listeria booriae]|uniref:sugar-phosphate nucleotidyltransferase n=1 Tax=Listeria booriae TaxID=1552123 RepID=UPI0016261AE6|nr:sugar-phosphate nucleotidyltransferase [Listeria booriae]MBC2057967.1 sugar-phosphate nucleotidyltransferase [Listeria booriae]